MAISDTLLSKLKDKSLVTDKALVAGEWLAASESGRTFDVTNPVNGEVLATLPNLTRAELTRAIDKAHEVQKAWASAGLSAAGLPRKWYMPAAPRGNTKASNTEVRRALQKGVAVGAAGASGSAVSSNRRSCSSSRVAS